MIYVPSPAVIRELRVEMGAFRTWRKGEVCDPGLAGLLRPVLCGVSHADPGTPQPWPGEEPRHHAKHHSMPLQATTGRGHFSICHEISLKYLVPWLGFIKGIAK